MTKSTAGAKMYRGQSVDVCIWGASCMHSELHARMRARRLCAVRRLCDRHPRALHSAPAAPSSPQPPELLRKKPLEQVVHTVPDVHASQLAGQATQLPATATVLAGHDRTVPKASHKGGRGPWCLQDETSAPREPQRTHHTHCQRTHHTHRAAASRGKATPLTTCPIVEQIISRVALGAVADRRAAVAAGAAGLAFAIDGHSPDRAGFYCEGAERGEPPCVLDAAQAPREEEHLSFGVCKVGLHP